ncbi:outer membrane lipoprotein carrier protein LolA [Chryseobacterium sp. POL2]|uniref:LolA family protein n=1 Tax=Chryseobacterium sp. POL2 TaxID=2713414 RepID=UPI0013E0F04E|nr:outer membrane lipoprotein carrier protein LolA [Chryseobacterium sp. POL2]QIG88934.1 outer membrane lipoprotein carrier protein LolA [Chryseobacterium sp. POL2]
MKKILEKTTLLGISLFTFGISFAQKIDRKSQSILDAVTSNYKSKKNTYFKFTYGSGTGQVTKAETGIFYSSDDKYKLKIMGIEQIFDGSKVYNINDSDKEVTIAKPNDNDVMFSPLSYLESYKKDYNVTYVGKKNINGKSLDYIKMTPVKDNGLKQVNLYVNTPQKKLVKLEQIATNNQIATINISDYKENQNLSSGIFSFDKSKYAKYLITEL